MDTISKLFESNKGEVRVKMLRFFLSNVDKGFEAREVSEKLKLKSDVVRKEINTLLAANFILKENAKTTRNVLYKLNKNFDSVSALYNFVFDFRNMNLKEIVEKFKKVGKIKLCTFAGVFLGDEEGLVDILVVVENIKQKELEKLMTEMKIAVGRDLKYLVMDIDEYSYRHKMFDKVLHTVLDEERVDIINKLQ